MNYELLDEIQEWIDSGNWKNAENFAYTYDEDGEKWTGVYTAPWFLDLTEEEFENINWDEGEEDYYPFHLVIHIYKDNTYKLEFDPGLFNLMYKGYDTEADRKAWDEFREFIREQGKLLP
ncbi:MAG: hypothetical protein IH591_01975 [Bacteroidales bacterium]|nr:hypothetical protein [Bacteroidales bacterium]